MNAVEAYRNKDIDLQRLLWNNDPRKITGRRSGTTFSLLFYMAGHALWGDPGVNYLHIGRHRNDVAATFQELTQLLRYKGFTFEIIHRNHMFRIEETHQLFIMSTPETWVHNTRGFSIKEAFIDAPRGAFDPSEFAFMKAVSQKLFIVG